MRSRCALPLTPEALSAHGLTSRDQAHDQGLCTRILASPTPPRTPVRAAAPRAEENTAR
jgi:hypothetical protein